MRRARIRFTIWQTLMSVAILGIVMSIIPDLVDLLSGEGPYNALQRLSKRWQCGPAPSITVDVREGSIEVVPSAEGEVSAEILFVTVTKRSQWAADRASEDLHVSTRREADSIAIAADGVSVPQGWLRSYITNQTSIVLGVPDGSHLNLRVRKGRISVGETISGGQRIRQDVRAASINALNESKLEDRNPFGLGDIVIKTSAPLAFSSDANKTTQLVLEAPGEIDVHAENALVDARAGHQVTTTNDVTDKEAMYRDGRECTIKFDGSLAIGQQSFRAGRNVTINLAAPSALRVIADAGQGISGDLINGAVQSSGRRKLWRGSFGDMPHANLMIHSSDGAISLNAARTPISKTPAESRAQRGPTGAASSSIQPK